MSRLTELKKQYPELNLSVFDLLENIDTTKTYKYLPLLCKLFSQRFEYQGSLDEIKRDREYTKELLQKKGLNFDYKNDYLGRAMYVLSDFFPNELFETTSDFISRMEKNKIPNRDLSTYSSLDSLRKAISLSSLKDIEKELESQIVKEYEDDTWLILKPLTFESSAKYGSSTRWCTTYHGDKSHFVRYWRRGILVYFINKENGYKFAGFKSLDSENELSFWDPSDQRLDFLQLDVNDYLFPIVKKIFSSTETNRDLCTLGMIRNVENYSDQFRMVSENLFGDDPDIIGPVTDGTIPVPTFGVVTSTHTDNVVDLRTYTNDHNLTIA
jgi:hypothetical protein